jgi:hypothetical protein
VLLQFHEVTYVLDRPAEARKKLEAITEQARAAITEWRDAVQGLRSSTVVTNDLARSITIVGDWLAAELSSTQAGQNCPEFRVQLRANPGRSLSDCLRGVAQCLPPRTRETHRGGNPL